MIGSVSKQGKAHEEGATPRDLEKLDASNISLRREPLADAPEPFNRVKAKQREEPSYHIDVSFKDTQEDIVEMAAEMHSNARGGPVEHMARTQPFYAIVNLLYTIAGYLPPSQNSFSGA